MVVIISFILCIYKGVWFIVLGFRYKLIYVLLGELVREK